MKIGATPAPLKRAKPEARVLRFSIALELTIPEGVDPLVDLDTPARRDAIGRLVTDLIRARLSTEAEKRQTT